MTNFSSSYSLRGIHEDGNFPALLMLFDRSWQTENIKEKCKLMTASCP